MMRGATDSRRSGSADGPDEPWVGRVIADRYALEKRLGTGTLGFVYQARHTTLDRRVTLELLDAELVDREAVRECFKSAMKQLARVRHRNVVELESSGVDADGALYVVTKHVAAPRLDFPHLLHISRHDREPPASDEPRTRRHCPMTRTSPPSKGTIIASTSAIPMRT